MSDNIVSCTTLVCDINFTGFAGSPIGRARQLAIQAGKPLWSPFMCMMMALST